MNKKEINPDTLSVELDGVAALACCMSILFGESDDKGGTPKDAVLSDAFLGIEMHLKRISKDIAMLDRKELVCDARSA